MFGRHGPSHDAVGRVLIVSAAILCTPPLHAQNRVVRTPAKETPLADVPYEAADGRIFVSADGRSSAFVARRDAGLYVSHDGKLIGPFDAVAPGSPRFSFDGKRLAFAARCDVPRAGANANESDARPWDDGTWRVVLDGKPADVGYAAVAEETIRFSSDGAVLAYVVRSNGKAIAVRNGAASAAYDDIRPDAFDLLPDGRLLFVARRDGAEMLVTGPEEGPPFAAVGRPKLGIDGRLAYAATPAEGGPDVLIVNGAEAARAERIDPRSVTFALAPGGPLAYTAGPAGKVAVHVIVDAAGNVNPPPAKTYDRIPGSSLTFSPDGRRLAFVGWREGWAMVVSDGVESAPYFGARPGTLRFSPDGRRLAYVVDGLTTGGGGPADVGHASAVVVDGREGRPYAVIRTAPAFTPDGRHVGYVAQRRRVVPGATAEQYECVVVVDEVEGRPYPWIRAAPFFDRTGARMAYVASAGDDRLADADELPRLLDDPTAGGVLVLDKSLAARERERFGLNEGRVTGARPQPASGRQPIRLLLVEEQLREE